MDLTNLKQLGPKKWRVRFKYTCARTGERKVYQQTLSDVSYQEAREHRDHARVDAPRKSAEPNRQPLSDFADSFLVYRGTRGRKPLSHLTLQRDANALYGHIVPDAGHWVVHDITRGDLDGLVDYWLDKKMPERLDEEEKPLPRETYSSSTVATWLKTLKLFVRYACGQVGRGDDPTRDVESVPVQRRKATPLTITQLTKLLDYMHKHDTYAQHWAFVLVAACTGARYSEVSALHWDDVDEVNSIIRFGHKQNQGVREVGSKTGRRWTFPLLEPLQEALRWHRTRMVREQHPGVGWGVVFPTSPQPGRHGSGEPASRYVWPNTIRNAVVRSCRKLKLPEITTHDLRVSFVTIALDHGVQGEILRTVTGHQDEAMGAYYYHGNADAQRRLFGPLAAAISGSGSTEG